MKPPLSGPSTKSAAARRGTTSETLSVMGGPSGRRGHFSTVEPMRGLRPKIPSMSGPCDDDLGVAVAAPIDLLATARPGDVGVRTLFQHGDGALLSPPPINRFGKRAFPEFLAVRRIAKDELEGLQRASLAELGRVAPPDLGDAGQAECLDIAANGGARSGAFLDDKTIAGAAR